MMVAVATAVHELLTGRSVARSSTIWPRRLRLWSTLQPRSWRRRTGLDEGLEQAGVLAGLRVPLHRHPEARPGLLHRLQRSVLRPGGRDITGVTGHGLVVIAGYGDLLPEDGGHPGAFDRAHVMGAIDPRGR